MKGVFRARVHLKVFTTIDGNVDNLYFRSARYVLQRGEVAIVAVEHFQTTPDSHGNDKSQKCEATHMVTR